MSRGTHRPRRSTRPHLTALGRAVGIEQRFPKPRVGSSTLPRPTTLDLSFSSSSTIPSLRRNAPKWCKCHKSVIVFDSKRGQTDQNESRPATLLLSVGVARAIKTYSKGAPFCNAFIGHMDYFREWRSPGTFRRGASSQPKSVATAGQSPCQSCRGYRAGSICTCKFQAP